MKNGHNSFFTSFDATINPSLTCIQVDDAAWSTDNWLNKDDAASYSTDCPLIIYVDASKADDTGDGQTWATAKKSLQTALGLAVSGDQIWVKAGTYKPGTSRDNSFGLKSDVSVYGGFAGTEISVSERSIAANETILSGEIGAATNTDNCYIVVLSKSISNALLDGFTIKGGYMNGPAPAGQWQKDGGGIHHNFSQVTYNNLKIIQNYAEWNGSGVFVTGSGLATFYNCVIADNTGNTGAGSFSVFLGYSTLNNCTFTNNSPNQITVDAGGYSNSFNNCIIWGGTNNINIISGTVPLSYCNYQSCGISGSITAGQCITSDPKFVDAAHGDYRLCGNSPCVDAGSDYTNSLLTDIRGFDFGRKLLKTSHSSTGTIDIGAYEYKEGTDQLLDIAAPTTQASNLVFSSVQASQMTIGWTNGNGTSRAVFVKAANTGTATPVDNTTYTANTTFSSGTQICLTGWYCVYNGTETSVTLTGLNALTDYIAQVFEYYGTSGSETYNIATATNNPKSQTTVGTPTVTTQAVTSITNITATGNGNITNLGVSNPNQYGVVWSTTTNPTVALTTKTAQGAIAVT
ncbi:MAG: choice-of-anchor Q domain-containing protein, partial [Bacteroidota bacterium]